MPMKKDDNIYVFDTFDELTDYVALAFTSTNDWVCHKMEDIIGDKITLEDREKVHALLANGFMQLADNMKCSMAEYEHLVREGKVSDKQKFKIDPKEAGFDNVEELREKIKKDVKEGTEFYTRDIENIEED